MEENNFDVIILGAGVSGVDAAYRIQHSFPNLSYTILEAQKTLGGTWSFWKYPGFRSDSYMAAYAFSWYKWPSTTGIIDGAIIKQYVEDAAKSAGIDKMIRYSHRAIKATWDSSDAQWLIHVTTPWGEQVFRTSFLFSCTGYYDYDTPFQSPIPGLESFQGKVAVPQFWPQDLDYAGKKMILIGSGATAITLLPSLAQKAGHLTLLQRSPSYVLSVDANRSSDNFYHWLLPEPTARFMSYWTMLVSEVIFTSFLKTYPGVAKRLLLKFMAKELPESIPVEKHFNPSYPPFEQRLGMCPDGDFFKALHKPHVDIVTDIIDTVTPTGIKTKGGANIEADIIVPATGLRISPAGGMRVEVDGTPVVFGDKFMWRGCMLDNVPNMGMALGYFQNSWTPGADIGIKQLIRVMKEMHRQGATQVTPCMTPSEREKLSGRPFFNSSATYIQAALERMPKATDWGVWTGRRNWVIDSLGDWLFGIKRGLRYTGGRSKAL